MLFLVWAHLSLALTYPIRHARRLLPKTKYYSIIKRSTPESYRKKPCGVTKKVCNFPDGKHGYLIKMLASSHRNYLNFDTTDTRMIVRSTHSDWPINPLHRRSRASTPKNSLQRHPTTGLVGRTNLIPHQAGGARLLKRPTHKCPNRLTNTPTSRPGEWATRYLLANQLVAHGSDLT